MAISNASSNDANDVLNIFQHGGNVTVGKNGTIYIPVIINNVSGTKNVYLYLYGRKASADSTNFNHGMLVDHTHYILSTAGSSGSTSYAGGTTYDGVVLDRGDNTDTRVSVGELRETSDITLGDVPQAVQIWIDGTEYTATIDDPNGKGATMYDGTNDDWGVDGTTEWSTGRLNLSSLITWTAGEHYIELKETGGTGGVLVYHVVVNTGY